MAFHDEWFYVANTNSIVRFKYKNGQTAAEGEPEKLVELTPGGYNQHWTRNIVFSKDGKQMFVSIGSATNVNVEADPKRAAISVYDPDGEKPSYICVRVEKPDRSSLESYKRRTLDRRSTNVMAWGTISFLITRLTSKKAVSTAGRIPISAKTKTRDGKVKTRSWLRSRLFPTCSSPHTLQLSVSNSIQANHFRRNIKATHS
jgi:hypothetical protein